MTKLTPPVTRARPERKTKGKAKIRQKPKHRTRKGAEEENFWEYTHQTSKAAKSARIDVVCGDSSVKYSI